MGDLNGKTRLGEDFVRDGSDKHSPINLSFYTKDTHLDRSNSDTHPIDQQGKKILQLCKSLSVRILNGRTPGDLSGRLTRYPAKPNEIPSAIDYALCCVPMMKDISFFTVSPLTEISDHCCISLRIKANVPQPETNAFDNCNKINDIIEMHSNEARYTFDCSKENLYVKIYPRIRILTN